jgi:DNA polymerase/3'-5' exonuclease PolX
MEEWLTEMPGVGDAIAVIITKLYRTGTHPSLEKLRKEIPARVLELLTVPGLRPEKVLHLYKDLGITSLAELEAAAILTVSLLRAFFDRRINPAAKMSYPWERHRPREESRCGKRL